MQSTNCPACKHESNNAVEYCLRCNFPFLGSETEKSAHIGKFISEKNILTDSEKAIKKSRNVLFIISGLNFLMFVIAIFSPEYYLIDALVNLMVAAIFALFASFLKRSPVVFSIIPLVFLTMIYLISFMADPNTIIKGIIFKMFIIGSLGYGAYQCYKAEKFRKKYNL